MVGRHHSLNGHEFEQAPGHSEGQGSLVSCSPWGLRVRHDEQLNNNQVLSTRAHGHTYSSHNPERKELFGAHFPIRDPRLGDGDTVGLYLDGSDHKGSMRRGGLPPGKARGSV